jgi:hypothetical protein
MTLSCVSTHHTFMFWMFSGRLTAPKWHSYADWHFQRCEILPRQWRKHDLRNYHVPKCANYDLSCSSHAGSFLTICNVCGFRRRLFRRILWTVACGICNSVLAREMDFFWLCVKACLTRSVPLADLFGRPVECRFFTLPISVNCLYHLIMLMSSGGLSSKFTLNSNSGFKFCVPQHGLCFLLHGRHCADRPELVIKAAVR